MKFGKLPDISQVNFSLPADPDYNQVVFQNTEIKSNVSNLYIGCTGWSMKEWVGNVYPIGTKPKDYLQAYAKQFNTIELNTTHYRIPNKTTIQKWYRETPADFRFCPKVSQYISHSRDLGLGGTKILDFCDAVVGLEEKLGCCFLQLPPFFGKDKIELLATFLDRWYTEIPLAIELRHESWFENKESLLPLLDLLAKEKYEHKIGLVLTDVAGRRDVLSMALATSFTVIRFVGNGLDPSDYTRIDEWVERIRRWTKEGIHPIYFFTHEPDNILAPRIADYLHQHLKKIEHVSVRGPQLIQENIGQQMSLF